MYTWNISWKWNWNLTFIWTMRCKWKPDHMLALCVFSMLFVWVLGGPRVLTSYRMSTRGSRVMRYDGMFEIIWSRSFYNPTMVIWWYALCSGAFDVLWCSSVFLWEAEMFVYETLDPTIFGVIDQLYLDYFSSCLDGTEV